MTTPSSEPRPGWLERLKTRWQLTSNFQVVIVLIVFAITGSTTAWVTKPVYGLVGIGPETAFGWKVLAFFFIMLPVYNVLLIIVGSIFGQFRFFWNFEKKTLGRMIGRKSNQSNNN